MWDSSSGWIYSGSGCARGSLEPTLAGISLYHGAQIDWIDWTVAHAENAEPFDLTREAADIGLDLQVQFLADFDLVEALSGFLRRCIPAKLRNRLARYPDDPIIFTRINGHANAQDVSGRTDLFVKHHLVFEDTRFYDSGREVVVGGGRWHPCDHVNHVYDHPNSIRS